MANPLLKRLDRLAPEHKARLNKPIAFEWLERPECADRFMAAVGKLVVREQALRADLAAGRISDDDPRWLDNRPISRLYAREGRE